MNDSTYPDIGQEIKVKGKTAPRITPQIIEDNIVAAETDAEGRAEPEPVTLRHRHTRSG